MREQCLRPLWTSPEGHKTKRLSFLREHPAIGGGALRTRATCERVCFGFDANLCRITSGSKFVSNVAFRMIPSNPAITTERLFLRRKCPLPHTFRPKFAANRLQIPQKRCKRLRKCYKMLRFITQKYFSYALLTQWQSIELLIRESCVRITHSALCFVSSDGRAGD